MMAVSMHAKQGDPDGLCGIYCLINFMRDWKFERDLSDNHRESFRYLLRSAERLKLLTADRLHDGFEWHELCEIFNLTTKSLHEPYQSIPIVALQRRFPRWTNRDLLCAVFEDSGEAVVSVDRHKHWVLAFRFISSDTLSVFDSNASSRRKSIEIRELARPFNGLALLPAGSTLLGIG
jgi:hypothetical protein